MTRVLLDQGIARSAVDALAAAQWDVEHVADIGLDRATDEAILVYARENRRVICTLDADFHALLAVSGQDSPSVVRIRQEGLRGEQMAGLLLRIWPDVAAAVAQGAAVSVTAQNIRIRRLPVRAGAGDENPDGSARPH